VARTGRAGRKGIAVLIVPFRRRRAVDAMLRRARIEAEWIEPPTPDEIRTKDRDRLLEMLSAPAELDEEDRELAKQLMDRLPAEEIAATLVRALRADLPAPEDILALGGRDERGESGPRPGFEGSTWFVINAGRRHNADPRWLLPLICRYGHVGRNDIGAIRVAANESYFEVTQRAAPGFIKALRRATIAPEDEGLMIEQAPPRLDGTKPDSHPSKVHQRPKVKGQQFAARKQSRR
jgi:ATP-dependent RNA helicase DeaD